MNMIQEKDNEWPIMNETGSTIDEHQAMTHLMLPYKLITNRDKRNKHDRWRSNCLAKAVRNMINQREVTE